MPGGPPPALDISVPAKPEAAVHLRRFRCVMWPHEVQAVRVAAQKAVHEIFRQTHEELQAMHAYALQLPVHLPEHLSQGLCGTISAASAEIELLLSGPDEPGSQLTLFMHIGVVKEIRDCIAAVRNTDNNDTNRECLIPQSNLYCRWMTLRLHCELLENQMRKLVAQ